MSSLKTPFKLFSSLLLPSFFPFFFYFRSMYFIESVYIIINLSVFKICSTQVAFYNSFLKTLMAHPRQAAVGTAFPIV